MSKPAKRTFSTPMMQQYMSIKRNHEDCLLFFRLGDFYELFLDDAEIGAKILGITLTQRPRGKDGRIPMAGVPFHAADSYISKLVRAGNKVAICEQVSEPDSSGIVERKVVRIVTPGTVLDENSLNEKENNYTISLTLDEKNLGLAISDISTGDFQAAEFDLSDGLDYVLSRELLSLRPSECILNKELYQHHKLLKILSSHDVNVYHFEDWEKYSNNTQRFLKRHFDLESIGVFGIDKKKSAITASAVLLGYLKHTQKDKVSHISKIQTYDQKDYLVLDRSTITNLELFSTIRDREDRGSLISLVDSTSTAMGGRMLREWIKRPLKTKGAINARLDSVQELYRNPLLRKKIRKELNKLYDIERILSRLSVGVGVPADLINLKTSLNYILEIKDVLTNFESKQIKEINKNITKDINKTTHRIEKYINEDSIGESNADLINQGVNKKLDKLRESISGDKRWIAALEDKEKKRTKIANLRVRFNKVHGYFIEVSKSNTDLVPDDYIRKQTLVNAERYVTPELKEREERIMQADEKIEMLEQEIFNNVVDSIVDSAQKLQSTSNHIARLDCFCNFAHIASREQYVRPKINTDGKISLESGRHPVVEKMLHEDDKQFVPNEVLLDKQKNQMIILTGPNMAGKSVYIRQVAILTLMAHVGSFVPAQSANICLVDRIFVRSGASDVIASGLSTFMVEMVETAHILNHATDKSLIVVDEIGRGTSTYDGISIAWSVAEYLLKNTKAKTLFATHYHELQMLEDRYPNKIKNYQMAVEEELGEPVFLYKLKQGATSHSYAVAVAKLAGVPEEVTSEANKILERLENERFISNAELAKSSDRRKPNDEPELLKKRIIDLDIESLTPVEALNELNNLRDSIK